MLQVGVTPHSTYTTPNLQYMTPVKRRAHLAERAFAALFVAAHRGHIKLVERLIAEGNAWLQNFIDWSTHELCSTGLVIRALLG